MTIPNVSTRNYRSYQCYALYWYVAVWVFIYLYIESQSRVVAVGAVVQSSRVDKRQCRECASYRKDSNGNRRCYDWEYYDCYDLTVEYVYRYEGLDYTGDWSIDYEANENAAERDEVGKYAANATITVYIDSTDPRDSALTSAGVSNGWSMLITISMMYCIVFSCCIPCYLVITGFTVGEPEVQEPERQRYAYTGMARRPPIRLPIIVEDPVDAPPAYASMV